MNTWNADLAELQGVRPYRWQRLAPPSVIVLPAWLKAGLGAWTWHRWIVVTHQQAQCPAVVRRYVLAHEYGHIVLGHIVLHWIWILAAVLWLLAGVSPSTGVLALGLQVAVIATCAHPGHVQERELGADAVAAELCGAKAALAGASWMATATGQGDAPQRQLRLAALRSRAAARA